MKSLQSRKAVPRDVDLDPVCVIQEGGEEYCIYPLDRILPILGKKWTLFLIAVLGNEESMRFNAIQAGLRFISSRTLADRLKELTALGLVSREAYSEIPPKVEYRLTTEGQRMRQLLIPLLSWAIEFEGSQASTASTPGS